MKNENTAIVYGKDMPFSTKHAIEISNFIRGKNLQKAKVLLEGALKKTTAIPLKRFNMDRGHRKGKVGPGAYLTKAVKFILGLLNSLEANAQNKGLTTSSLVIKEIIPNYASRPFHYGRIRRIRMKRTHIKIIAEESKK